MLNAAAKWLDSSLAVKVKEFFQTIAMQLNCDALFEVLLSWWVRLLVVIAALIVGLFLPYPRIAQSEKYVPLTLLIVLVTILVFGIDLIRETSLNNLNWVRRSVSIVTTIAAMASVFKGTAEWRTWMFNPIREASGIGFINFDRLIKPSELGIHSWYPLVPPIKIRTAIVGGLAPASFSMTNIEQTTGRTVINGAETRELYTRIRFQISSDSIAWPNGLEKVSAKKFTSTCNYLDVPIGVTPEDAGFDGVVYLTLNGDQHHTFVIPKAYPPTHGTLFVPMNDGARQEMMKYKPWGKP